MLTDYSEKESTWEPEENIPDHIVEDYKKKIKDKRKKRKPFSSRKTPENETCVVESISDCRVSHKSKNKEYFVKWKGNNFILSIFKQFVNLFDKGYNFILLIFKLLVNFLNA